MAPQGPHIDVGIRIQCLVLLEFGVPIDHVAAYTNVTKSSIYRFRRIAIQRGYDPNVSKRILLSYLEDAPKSGRPSVCTEEATKKVINFVTKSAAGRESTCTEIAANVGITARSIHRILRRNRFRKCKRTVKPGLTEAMKDARLQFCLRVKDWTLEDWKAVIWSDETSVVLGHRRGAIRVWRRAWEKYNKTCMTRRWKSASEFMFWGCFSYDKKGPFYIWKNETAAEKKEAQEFIDKWNSENEAQLKQEWEAATAIRRRHITRGRKPSWRFNKANGKMTRSGRGGIDWYRYQKKILEAKLIPFAKKCMETRPNT